MGVCLCGDSEYVHAQCRCEGLDSSESSSEEEDLGGSSMSILQLGTGVIV